MLKSIDEHLEAAATLTENGAQHFGGTFGVLALRVAVELVSALVGAILFGKGFSG